MNTHREPSQRHSWRILQISVAALVLTVVASCARMGHPDGGWYDDTPPFVVSATPADGATDVKAKKVIINFNEYIKIENAQEKVIVSPPQLEQAR